MLVTTPNDGDAGARRLVGMYEDVELVLLLALRDAISKALEADTPQARQRQLNILLDTVAKQLNRVGGLVESQAGRVAADEYDAAIRAVYEEVGAELQAGGVRPDVWRGISSETAAALRSQHVMVAREIRDVYQQVTMTTVRAATVEGMDHPRALQVALNRFADKGITGFVDKGGRRWSIDVYADMAVRTMRNNIRQEGHLRGYEETGVELVHASWHPASAPQCFPYQNELLAITGPAGPRVMVDPATGRNVTVTVKATLRDAIAAGYHHPNAILGGDQSIDTFAGTVGASKGTYCGPAFTIRTAQGNTATVSPEHPILTSAGWRTAESISVGDYLFNAVNSEGTEPIITGEAKFKEMPTTVEDEFATFERNGTRMSVTTAGYHFNDDRQFLEGEVHVVVPDDGLLPVPDAEIIKETGEVRFVWADMGRGEAVGEGGLHSLLRGVTAPIGWALPNGDTRFNQPALDGGGAGAEHRADFLAGESTLVEGDDFIDVDISPGLDGRDSGSAEAFAYRRAGDSEHPADICAAVPGVVEPDQVVSVEKIEFRGHAYDFQTELGFYALNGIVVHNCKHRDVAYTPGDEKPDTPETTPEENKRQYEATQRQRQIERTIRRWRKREAVALTPDEAALAKRKVKDWQAAQREHVGSHSFLSRFYHREQLRTN